MTDTFIATLYGNDRTNEAWLVVFTPTGKLETRGPMNDYHSRPLTQNISDYLMEKLRRMYPARKWHGDHRTHSELFQPAPWVDGDEPGRWAITFQVEADTEPPRIPLDEQLRGVLTDEWQTTAEIHNARVSRFEHRTDSSGSGATGAALKRMLDAGEVELRSDGLVPPRRWRKATA